MDAALSFSEVSFTYRGDWMQRIQALHGVSFQVPRGSVFGFLGANGAGKSTCIKLLNGLLQGHSGTIHLFGEALGPARLRRRLGYLPEQPYFYESLQVQEYLHYLGRLSGLSRRELPEAIDRVCARLDLDGLRRRRLGSFSKGMRQRFGLAQAIVHQPELLILDEPFSGLDPLWRARFKDIIREEAARGATLCFSSHILSDVEDLCDRYALIDHGHILEQGRMADLMADAPLVLTGSGPAPGGAQPNDDGTWSLRLTADQRAALLAQVQAQGGDILRLERQSLGLEAWFVQRVAKSHAAGRRSP